jgi:hypothetical protein
MPGKCNGFAQYRRKYKNCLVSKLYFCTNSIGLRKNVCNKGVKNVKLVAHLLITRDYAIPPFVAGVGPRRLKTLKSNDIDFCTLNDL